MRALCHVNSPFLHSVIVRADWKQLEGAWAKTKERNKQPVAPFRSNSSDPEISVFFIPCAARAWNRITESRPFVETRPPPEFILRERTVDRCALSRTGQIIYRCPLGLDTDGSRFRRNTTRRAIEILRTIYLYIYKYSSCSVKRGSLFRGRIRSRTRRKHPLKRKFPRRWKL